MKSLYSCLMALTAVFTSLLANAAENVVFSPRLTTGYINYKLETPPILGVAPPQKFKANAALIGVGATVSWNRFYLDLYGQVSDNASDEISLPAFNYEDKFDGNITDYSFAVGAAITDNFSIYTGYKYNKLDSSSNNGSKSIFKVDGYFIGASYGWIIQESSVLTVNLAVADLDGNSYFQVPAVLPLNFDVISDAQGLSYGVSWKSNINKNWGYSVAFDGNQYRFKDNVDKRLGAYPGDIKQDIFTVKISVSYLFD